jgi:hypothetical protein
MVRAILFLPHVLVFGVGFQPLAAETGPAINALSALITNREVAALIKRNSAGASTEITLWGPYATDATFREISKIPTLERLRFSYSSKSNWLTADGILALTNAPKLSEVIFQCTRDAPRSFYSAIANLQQIESLRFVATWPTNSFDALPLTNLVSLKRIVISFAGHISSDDINILSQMRSLEDVKLWGSKVSEADLAPLIANKAITNLEVRAGTKVISIAAPPVTTRSKIGSLLP